MAASIGANDLPVLFHVHGLGDHDFSSLRPDELHSVQEHAGAHNYSVVPTIFLRRRWLTHCEHLLTCYSQIEEELPNLRGFAIEGPLLGPAGGTPRAASWMPSVAEWKRIAALGRHGLRYLVLAPDAMELNELVGPGMRLIDLVECLSENGVRIALGHFDRSDPQLSAERARLLIEAIQEMLGPSKFNVLTDHLYNDMPRNFTHAWRGDAFARRERELAEFLRVQWRPGELVENLGPVPAGLLEAAREGVLLPCLNFDGFHVDLEVCKRTVEYLGAHSLIAITDHTETLIMAGEVLHHDRDAALWYRDDEIVAAGSKGLDWHLGNMRAIGLSEAEISAMTVSSPHRAIDSSRTVLSAW